MAKKVSDFMPEGYDASIQARLAETELDWGSPIKNREGLIPYGIAQLDKALYGMDGVYGEFILVQGPQKNRKTTFWTNVVINYMMPQNKPLEKPFTIIDVLESSLPVNKWRDQVIANVAARYLIEGGHKPHPAHCPACGARLCKELILSSKFLRYNSRSRAQLEAIEYAKDIIISWPLHIYGANYRTGNTRSLKTAIDRYGHLIENEGAKIIITDHVQQYQWVDEPTDYEKQIRAVGSLSDVVAGHSIIMLAISQVSLKSQDQQRRLGTVLTASGGAKGAQEGSVVLTTKYKTGDGEMIIKIEEAREAGGITVIQPLDDKSGAFYGDAFLPYSREADNGKDNENDDFTL